MDFKDVLNQSSSLDGVEVSIDGVIAAKVGQSHWYLTDLESLLSRGIDRAIRLVEKFKSGMPSRLEHQESLERFFEMFAVGKFDKNSEAEARIKYSRLLVEGTEDALNFFIEAGALTELDEVLELPRQRYHSRLTFSVDADYAARIQELRDTNYIAYRGTVLGTVKCLPDQVTIINLKSITIYSSNNVRYITQEKTDLSKFDLGVGEFATSKEIFKFPEKYLGKRVKVGKYRILTHSDISFVVPSFAHSLLKNREKYGLLIESPQFEKAIENVQLTLLNTINISRCERMDVVGEIVETSQSPFKFSVKGVSCAVYDTSIGLYEWRSHKQVG